MNLVNMSMSLINNIQQQVSGGDSQNDFSPILPRKIKVKSNQITSTITIQSAQNHTKKS